MMSSGVNIGEDLPFSFVQGSLADRVAAMLSSLPAGSVEHVFALDDLSLRLGLRLPDLAQTATFWQRGELGRRLRGLGFGVRVQYGQVVFTGVGAGCGK